MLILALLPLGCMAQNQASLKNHPVNFSQVSIDDAFWSPRLKTHADVTLKACMDQGEFKTHRVANFAIAAGMEEGEFDGYFYDDSDLHKMLEGASYALQNHPDAALDARIDRIIEKVAKAQREDGYLDTYFILGDYSKRWTDMNLHEMYICGHLIEAGLAHYNATGKKSLLNVAIKFADHLVDTFGGGKRNWVPGHPEIELALIKLYDQTGEKKYLDLSKQLIDSRGNGYGTWSEENREYYLDLYKVKDLEKIHGHAVRGMYLFTAMADYAAETGDTEYLDALERLWNNVVNTRMYVTGGIGSSARNEGFTYDYDLPNKDAYCETCASVGMVLWNQRMNMLKGDGKYIDILEKCMYNGALAGISLSGDRFFYVNPLESDGNHHRQEWYGCACCPSQISRFLPSIGGYIYATSSDALWVNLYIGSSAEMTVGKNKVKITDVTNYPWDGGVRLSVNPSKAGRFNLKLRIPGWCKDYSITVNGKAIDYSVNLGYAQINRKWRKGDKVEINFSMPVEVVSADPRVKADVGRRAITRGPLVYCIEQVDNANIADAALTAGTSYEVSEEKDLLGGVNTITAKEAGLKFIPYYAWDNREAGKMLVWVKYNE